MVSSAIEKIYETIEAPDLLPDALDAVARAMQAKGALIVMLLPNRSRIVIPAPGLAAAAQDYIENWAAQDIRSNRIEDRKITFSHNTVTDEDVVTPEEMDTDPFYAVFLRKHDLRYFCASAWQPTMESSLALSVQRSEAQGEFTAADRETAIMFGRHIERAMRLRGRLLQEEARRETLETIVDNQGQAVIITELDGKVRYSNNAAKQLPKELLDIVGGRLRFGPAAPSAQIADLMREAHGGSADATSRTLFLEARQDAVGYALNVMRQPSAGTDALGTAMDASAPVVLILTPVRVAQDFDAAITRDFLRLSLGEARVAAKIAGGRSPSQVAAELGLTRETVRFVLKQVFRKTGFRRQSELAAALSTLRALPVGVSDKP